MDPGRERVGVVPRGRDDPEGVGTHRRELAHSAHPEGVPPPERGEHKAKGGGFRGEGFG